MHLRNHVDHQRVGLYRPEPRTKQKPAGARQSELEEAAALYETGRPFELRSGVTLQSALAKPSAQPLGIPLVRSKRFGHRIDGHEQFSFRVPAGLGYA
jgi:hypothetical protein